MKCNVTLMISKKMEIADPDDSEELDALIHSFESKRWSVSVESVEPVEEEVKEEGAEGEEELRDEEDDEDDED